MRAGDDVEEEEEEDVRRSDASLMLSGINGETSLLAAGDAPQPLPGVETRALYLELLRQVANLPPTMPDEDGLMLAGMVAMARMSALTAILGLKAYERAFSKEKDL